MSKESDAICRAWSKGMNDKRLNRGYHNPFNKNRDKHKYKAYHTGYNN